MEYKLVLLSVSKKASPFKDERLAIDGKDLVMKYWNEQSPIRYEKQ